MENAHCTLSNSGASPRDFRYAVKRGIFGAPSYLYDGQIFWGQDRLDFLDRALD